MRFNRTSWPFHSPQSAYSHMTPSKHKDHVPPTYTSGGPERGPDGSMLHPSVRSSVPHEVPEWVKGQ